MRAYRGTVFKAALLSTCLLTPVAAWAQSADQSATIVDEVVVTGRRAADRVVASTTANRSASSWKP